jgi:hypothetical protein
MKIKGASDSTHCSIAWLQTSKMLIFLPLLFLLGIAFEKYFPLDRYIESLANDKDYPQFANLWTSSNKVRVVENWIASYFTLRPTRINLDIKQKHFQKLKFKQQKVLQGSGFMMSSSDDFVPLDILFKGQSAKGKVRLKGDWNDHLQGDKWSYRIKLKGESTIHGVKCFSLHAPRCRNYLSEWLFHQVLIREGIVALRYDFHELFINGESFGIYAFEEHFEKRLIENNRRREGVIFKFDEADFWRQMAHTEGWDAHPHLGLQTSLVDSFESGRLKESSDGCILFAKGFSLLDAFRKGDLQSSQVFDPSLWATFYSLLDLFGANHSTQWNNIRFYLNPISGFLEPVAFDGNCGLMPSLLLDTKSEMEKKILADPIIHDLYIKELHRVSTPGFVSGCLAQFENGIQQNESYIQIDEPGYEFTPDFLLENAKTIMNRIAEVEPSSQVR